MISGFQPSFCWYRIPSIHSIYIYNIYIYICTYIQKISLYTIWCNEHYMYESYVLTDINIIYIHQYFYVYIYIISHITSTYFYIHNYIPIYIIIYLCRESYIYINNDFYLQIHTYIHTYINVIRVFI